MNSRNELVHFQQYSLEIQCQSLFYASQKKEAGTVSKLHCLSIAISCHSVDI